MKKILIILMIILISSLAQIFSFFPWWGFLVFIFSLGLILPLKKWNVSPFLLGFTSGLLNWTLSTFYFETTYNGEIINKTSELIGVPYYLLYLIIGLIGGTLTGLAFYSGFLLRRGKEVLHLELPEN